MATVTCHTEGCAKAGVGVDVELMVDLDGEMVRVDVVECGACGQPITDITDDQEPAT